MIRVSRPTGHSALEEQATLRLPFLRALKSAPTSKDIDGYQVVAVELWKAQNLKCCYCELKIFQKYNDVEHYRPKARADRLPGCVKTGGYWWLAFSLSNLLFACPGCNRSAKNDLFPLVIGSTSLNAEEAPPGKELPLLLDPGGDINPVEHVQFGAFEPDRIARCTDPLLEEAAVWLAEPRNGSAFGRNTIDVVDLNRGELIELRSDHVRREVRPRALELLDSLDGHSHWKVTDRMNRALALLSKKMPFSAVSYDALRSCVSTATLSKWNLSWPDPSAI